MQRVALVTGTGSGLGRGIVRELARAGYDVAMHSGSNPERALALAEEIKAETGRRAEVFESDFMKAGAAIRLFEGFRKRFDRLDLFVNNAGVTMGGPILDMDEATFDKVMNINYKAAYFCVQQAARTMVDAGVKGTMILISSNNHAMNWYGASAYAISKESLVKLTRHAAMEFAQYGIRVNCIAPGYVDTGEARMAGQKEGSIPEIPMKRWVQPKEIGRMILFMAGEDCASLTGDVVELDGGVRIMTGAAKSYRL